MYGISLFQSGTIHFRPVSNAAVARFKNISRVLVRAAFVLLGVLLSAAAVIPIQQQLFRSRAEHLLADMQAIELHRTSWTQAQVLMHRWGRWGHYDGACTAENCKYTITLSDMGSGSIRPDDYGWTLHVISLFVGSPMYRWLGGREGTVYAGFIVQDGTIWRRVMQLNVQVPPRAASRDDTWGYGLIVRVQSRSSLNPEARKKHDHWILGEDEQLAEHPYYKAGRPGGCEICMAAEVTYATDTPQSEIRGLTSFDFSCMTRWHPCLRVEELLPAAKPWHLYQLDGDPPEPKLPKGLPESCKTQLWAIGRDALWVFAVDTLATTERKRFYDGSPYQEAQVRLVETLKGPKPWPAGTVLTADPFSGESTNPPLFLAEPMDAGKRYLAVVMDPEYSFHQNDAHALPAGSQDGIRGIKMTRCGVFEDTPRNRRELERGYEMNDLLRIDEF